MANLLYPKWKEALAQAAANSSLAGDVRVALVDTNDVSYDAADEFLADIAAGIVARSGALANKTFTGGNFDSDNPQFAAATGDQSEALVIFTHTGNDATARLVAWFDDGVVGLPVTPNGGDINIQWDAAGIFQL